MSVIGAIEWSRGIEDAWAKLAEFVPKLVGALVVLVIGVIVARVIRAAARRLLKATNVDQHLAKTSLGQSLARSTGGSPSNLLVRVLYAGLLLLVAQIAIGAFGKSPVADALNSMLAYIPKILMAIVILFVTGWVVEKVVPIVRDVTATKSFGSIATKATAAGIWLIGGFAALDQVQVARDVVDTLFKTIITSLGAILVIKFGVGGIWAARDRFWPKVYDGITGDSKK